MSESAGSNIPASLIEKIQLIYASDYYNYAILTVLFYDAAITAEKEMVYFWSKPKSPATILFNTNRFFAALHTLLTILAQTLHATTTICNSGYIMKFLTAIVLLCIDYTLLIRVRALYLKSQKVSRTLFFAFGVNATSYIVTSIYAGIAQHDAPEAKGHGIILCSTKTVSPIGATMQWSIATAYWLFLTCLVLYRAMELWKESDGRETLPSLVGMLIRDHSIFVALLIARNIFLIIALLAMHNVTVASDANKLANPALLSIFSARLLLNMKEAGRAFLDQRSGSNSQVIIISTVTSTMSEIVFTPPSSSASESMISDRNHGQDIMFPSFDKNLDTVWE